MAQRGGDGRTYERTYGQKISPFYRTLSPIGAAALPPPMKTKKKVEQGKGTADHLMPLGYLLFLTDYKENDKVRITRNGSFASAGLLEVFHDGEWGTVCDDRFGDVNAGIVCRMLGYATGTAHIKAAFGQGSGRIWLDNVFCRGDELSIFDCPANPIGDEDCEHDEDIGVSCTGQIVI